MPINYRFYQASCVVLLCVSLFSAAESAQKHYKDFSLQPAYSENTWFGGIGYGVNQVHMTSSSTSVSNGAPEPAPYNQDLYTINNPSGNDALQINAGYRWHCDKKFLPYASVYVQFRHYNNANITGNINQYSLPDFLNYHYQFAYSANLFTINGKINLFDAKYVMPYVSGGIGLISNRLNSYSETPTVNVTPRTSPAFASNSTTQFAGTLGVGVDFILTHNVWLTLGYDHVFQTALPKTSGRNTWSNSSISFGNVKLDTVFLNLSAKFPDTFR